MNEVIVEQQLNVAEVEAQVFVVEVAASGLRGERGDGVGAEVSAPAASTIHAGRAVRLLGGALSHPDIGNAAHAEQVVGIAETAASAGATARVRAAGRTDNPDWSWAPGPVYAGADGVLTQTPPTGAWLLVVGRPLSPTALLVDIEPPIYRS